MMKRFWYDNYALGAILMWHEIMQLMWNNRVVDWIQIVSSDFSIWVYFKQCQYGENKEKTTFVAEQGITTPPPAEVTDDPLFKVPLQEEV